jgi:hypothetical protein
MSLPECTCGHIGEAVEYHDGPNCARFFEWRTVVKVGRLDHRKESLIQRLAAGETADTLALEFQTQVRIFQRFAEKYAQEIEDAKPKEPPPAPIAAGGGNPR